MVNTERQKWYKVNQAVTQSEYKHVLANISRPRYVGITQPVHAPIANRPTVHN